MVSSGLKTFAALLLTNFWISCGKTAEKNGKSKFGTTAPGPTHSKVPSIQDGEQVARKVPSKPAEPTSEDMSSIGKIETVTREGLIQGWAGNNDEPAITYEIKLYLDGNRNLGTPLPSAVANLDAFDNDLTGPHAFSLRLPDALIDSKPHRIWAYTTLDGQDVLLMGSPFSYTAYKPKGEANATAFAQTNFSTCANAACHPMIYEVRWSNMLDQGADGTWTATSNALYDKVSGKLGHAGGQLPGTANLAGLRAWFTQEFGP